MGELKQKLRTQQQQADMSEIGAIAMDTHSFHDIGCAFVCMGWMDANNLWDQTHWMAGSMLKKFVLWA